jgi:hypothetical protein
MLWTYSVSSVIFPLRLAPFARFFVVFFFFFFFFFFLSSFVFARLSVLLR